MKDDATPGYIHGACSSALLGLVSLAWLFTNKQPPTTYFWCCLLMQQGSEASIFAHRSCYMLRLVLPICLHLNAALCLLGWPAAGLLSRGVSQRYQRVLLLWLGASASTHAEQIVISRVFLWVNWMTVMNNCNEQVQWTSAIKKRCLVMFYWARQKRFLKNADWEIRLNSESVSDPVWYRSWPDTHPADRMSPDIS